MTRKSKNADEVVKLTCELDRDVYDRLSLVSKRRLDSETAIMNQALKEHLFPNYRKQRDAQVIARLDDILRVIQSSRDTLDSTRDALGVFLEEVLEGVALESDGEERAELAELDRTELGAGYYPAQTETEKEDLLGL